LHDRAARALGIILKRRNPLRLGAVKNVLSEECELVSARTVTRTSRPCRARATRRGRRCASPWRCAGWRGCGHDWSGWKRKLERRRISV